MVLESFLNLIRNEPTQKEVILVESNNARWTDGKAILRTPRRDDNSLDVLRACVGCGGIAVLPHTGINVAFMTHFDVRYPTEHRLRLSKIIQEIIRFNSNDDFTIPDIKFFRRGPLHEYDSRRSRGYDDNYYSHTGDHMGQLLSIVQPFGVQDFSHILEYPEPGRIYDEFSGHGATWVELDLAKLRMGVGIGIINDAAYGRPRIQYRTFSLD